MRHTHTNFPDLRRKLALIALLILICLIWTGRVPGLTSARTMLSATEVTANATASLPPTISGALNTRQKGAAGIVSRIATVRDDVTPWGDLVVAVVSAPAGISITNISNNNGAVTANVAADCIASVGLNVVSLVVTDGEGLTRTANTGVNVTAPAPLSYPSDFYLNLKSDVTIPPSPRPNGYTGFTVAAPGFKGGLSVDQATGEVTISDAKPKGSFAVTVTSICDATFSSVFTMNVDNGLPSCPVFGDPAPNNAPAPGSRGSVLVFNYYSSKAGAPSAEDTQFTISNKNEIKGVAIHLFFVAANGQVADTFLCLAPNQSRTFNASSIDPGVEGYLIAVAVDGATGSPTSFNYLTGAEDIKLESGYSVSGIKADSFRALYLEGTSLPVDQFLATIRFDGVSYSRAARTLLLDDIRSPANGYETLLVFSRVGGNLATGGGDVGGFSGYLSDSSGDCHPFTGTAAAQFSATLSDSFPQTTPTFSQVISGNKAGSMVFWANNDFGLTGLRLDRGPSPMAAGSGESLRAVTLTSAGSLMVPVFPPSC